MPVLLRIKTIVSARFAWATLVAVAGAVTCRAATPRDELLKFVPEDVAFCVVLQDLRGHAAAVEASPLVEQFRASPFGKALADSHEARQLRKFQGHLQNLLGLDWPSLRDD